ncbi:unnamed protein product [Allacma fusca]|uniref:Uncharacterized protein n=1 Tax=Allacma fusca TaxID=39272 RepID=A0A8J2JHR4_9HEXA|nr:unnamed protein product [Allacma fusca]
MVEAVDVGLVQLRCAAADDPTEYSYKNDKQEEVDETKIPGSLSPAPWNSDLSDPCDKDSEHLSLGTFDSPLLKIDSPSADASQAYRLQQQDSINNAAFGQSANSAEESQRLGTTIQGTQSHFFSFYFT